MMICILDKSGKPLLVFYCDKDRSELWCSVWLPLFLLSPNPNYYCLLSFSVSHSVCLSLYLCSLFFLMVHYICTAMRPVTHIKHSPWCQRANSLTLASHPSTSWMGIVHSVFQCSADSFFLSMDTFWGKNCLLSVSCSLANKHSDITRANKCELNWNQKQRERNISQVTSAWMPLALFE